ncbi:FecR family protein [Puteibacter caeruleilacunae]|nr:FecR family protein [Puteibacter caeruleilacunae]
MNTITNQLCLRSMNKKLLDQLRAKEISFKDRMELGERFENQIGQSQLKESMRDQWDDTVESNDPQDMSPLFYKLFYRITKEREQKRTKSRRIFIGGMIAAAASILTFALLTIFSTVSEEVIVARVHSPVGVRTKFYLPDGTMGWLNGGSSIKYKKNKTTRNVDLSGCAFFDVAHNEKQPFQVKTTNLLVEVVGTEFSVTAYPEDTETDVILKKGKVNVYAGSEENKSVLKPNQQLTYKRSEKCVLIKKVDAAEQMKWIDGILSFENMNMRDVIKVLERYYNVNVVVKDTELFEYSFYGTIENETIDVVLKYMQMAIPMRWETQEQKPDAEGKLLRKTIELYMQ